MIKQLAWRIPLGILAGLIGLYAFPTENLWFLAPLIPALLLLATLGLGFKLATLVGFIAGQVFYVSHIEWLALYLGPVPLIGLSTLMSIYFALSTGLTAWLYRRLRPKGRGLVWFAFAIASIWTMREWIAANFPYGGFPWSRLGMTQSVSFLGNYAWWGGISLISFVIALLGALIALTILGRKQIKKTRLPLLILSSGLILLPLITPLGLGLNQVGELKIAAVQGNANAGLFSNLERGTILNNHLEATYENVPIDADIELIVWPENAADLSPLVSSVAREKLEKLVADYGAPITFGTITSRGEEIFNSTIFWDESVGPTDYYDKKRPVPFAEYVPDRAFWRMLAPDLIDLVSRGYSFGTRDGIFETEVFRVGSLICFEIAEDDIPRGLALEGAEIILSQTNNADFGYSDETYQQAAIARLRAIETGRVVVNISTVGLSAIYLPNGSVLDELEWFTSGAMVQSVPKYEGGTPALGIGLWFDAINAALAFSFVSLGFARRRR